IGTTDLDGTPAIGRLTLKGSSNNGSTNILVGRDSDEANVFSINTDGGATFGSVNSPYYQIATDTAYSSAWNGKSTAASKDAVYDKISTLGLDDLAEGTTNKHLTSTLKASYDSTYSAWMVQRNISSYSANQTLTANNHYVLITNGAANDTITPPITGISDGTVFYVKKIDNGAGATVMVVESGGTIDGELSHSIFYQYTSYCFVKSGSNYLIF